MSPAFVARASALLACICVVLAVVPAFAEDPPAGDIYVIYARGKKYSQTTDKAKADEIVAALKSRKVNAEIKVVKPEVWDAAKAAKAIADNAEPKSLGKCAKYVRTAMEAGGLETSGRPVSAKDYGPFLTGKGFKAVAKDGYTPQAGDIIVLQPTDTSSEHGHIAMYSGSEWVSDFKQKDMWGGADYRNKAEYVIYRR